MQSSVLTSQNATYVVSDLVPHRVPVVTPLVIIRNVLETHFAEVFVRSGGRDELIRGISADKTRPETLEVQASIIEGGFEWRDSEVAVGEATVFEGENRVLTSSSQSLGRSKALRSSWAFIWQLASNAGLSTQDSRSSTEGFARVRATTRRQEY